MLNFTDVTKFILLGLTSRPELQLLFFVVFLLVYIAPLIGNFSMIMLIRISPQLNSPMYFFLSHLSFADVWFSSNVTPKMLENLVSETKTISYPGCIVQCFFFIAFVHVEVFILAVMAFDRYMAIGSPLLYGSRMSRTVCIRLISFPYVYGFFISLISTLWTHGLYFCGNIEINHFYCADPALIKMACAGNFIKEYTMRTLLRKMLNFTDVTEFILLGLTSRREWQVLLFVIFLVVYINTLVGNIGMILLIKVSPQLSSPMYFFLSHLSFVDVWFSSNVTPKMLENLLSETKTISYAGCLVQCFFFIALVYVEIFILAAMAFDRYMAIGNPLLYCSKMSRVVCIRLIAFPYVYGFLTSLAATLWTYGLYFCGKIEINHFYCADPPLIKMACAGAFVKEYTMLILAGISFIYSLTVVILSYLFILTAILRMRSAEGRRKAFSTCGSHLTAVIIFYGTLIFMYLRRPTEESVDQGKMVAVFYTTVIPMLNPMIYSLRNKDVKEAMNKVISRTCLTK
ncbi:olfactory receptor 5M3-like [Hippopotamus amphibius kiboko]|uniref:olfactory receptor 5M3-like n=1 Tax=Hippopotamus amphibius kiboko TaxID=575201 RepID=UPI0025919763|nr:olfactory receptor 5M3-like [Hippopotamus amphibius kiboko]